MATLSFSNLSACSGGNHLHAKVTLGARSHSFSFHKDDMRADLTLDDLQTLSSLLMRVAVSKLNNPTRQQIANAITSLEVTLP